MRLPNPRGLGARRAIHNGSPQTHVPDQPPSPSLAPVAAAFERLRRFPPPLSSCCVSCVLCNGYGSPSTGGVRNTSGFTQKWQARGGAHLGLHRSCSMPQVGTSLPQWATCAAFPISKFGN